jgi:hypothetical protein
MLKLYKSIFLTVIIFIIVLLAGVPLPVKINNSCLPDKFDLSQNFPNPFNTQTKIKFEVLFNSKVSVSIFNILGVKISTPVEENLKPGYYEFVYDASDLSSGIYFYKFIAERVNERIIFTKKFTLIK